MSVCQRGVKSTRSVRTNVDRKGKETDLRGRADKHDTMTRYLYAVTSHHWHLASSLPTEVAFCRGLTWLWVTQQKHQRHPHPPQPTQNPSAFKGRNPPPTPPPHSHPTLTAPLEAVARCRLSAGSVASRDKPIKPHTRREGGRRLNILCFKVSCSACESVFVRFD